MPDELTNDQIALLCDIGEYDLSKATDQRKRELQELIDRGYVLANDQTPGRCKLSGKGVELLGERGAGLNEG
jgi:hypothetical protein